MSFFGYSGYYLEGDISIFDQADTAFMIASNSCIIIDWIAFNVEYFD